MGVTAAEVKPESQEIKPQKRKGQKPDGRGPKEKKRRDPDAWWRRIFWPMAVLAVLLACSLICELAFGGSITAFARLGCPFVDWLAGVLSPFFRADAITKVGETIGFCSILIAWTYKSLDKEAFGLRYGELVQVCQPHYHYYVFIHFVSILVCLWLSAAGLVEGAALALGMVLCGSWVQWNVLLRVVLSSGERARLAVELWDKKLRQAEESAETKPAGRWRAGEERDTLLDTLTRLASVLPTGDRESAKALRALMSKNVEKRCAALLEPGGGKKDGLGELFRIWEALMEHRDQQGRPVLARQILLSIPAEQSSPACFAYVLWAAKHHDFQKNGEKNPPENILVCMADEISLMEFDGVRWLADETSNHLWKAFEFMKQMNFALGNVELDSLDVQPRSFSMDETDKTLLRAAAQLRFGPREETWSGAFDQAYTMVGGVPDRSGDQEGGKETE